MADDDEQDKLAFTTLWTFNRAPAHLRPLMAAGYVRSRLREITLEPFRRRLLAIVAKYQEESGDQPPAPPASA